ncbi:unnamed protein product [Paramecium pentaurelia]|uniref:Uncharacterized protein n=1 Tax=Paramecium pentaurelia TaxID=43138 RepID=A0A8S1WH34_9CILI|nr:unnamed protein product [Paramecium pentaurelia]
MNFSLPDALNLIKEGRANEAVDQLNRFIECLQPLSPQTQLLGQQLGIDLDFFRIVKFSDFYDPDPQVQALRFKYYAYKIAKWGYQIIQQKRKAKRRHDIIDKSEQFGIQNEIGRTFGVDGESKQFAESRIQIMSDKLQKKKQIYQKQLLFQLDIEKRRNDYKQQQDDKIEKVRKALKTDYDNKIQPVKEHLEIVNEKLKNNHKMKKKQEDELINKRSELLKNASLIDEKINKLEEMRRNQIEHMKNARQMKKQRQHSFQEKQNQQYEEYLEKMKQKLQQRRIVDIHFESHKDFGKRQVSDDFEKNLENVINKYQKQQPIINNLLAKQIEQIQTKKSIDNEKQKKVKQNLQLDHSNKIESRNVDEVIIRKEKRLQEETILRKETYQQRVLNFLQNRQQLQRLQSQQIDRYNAFFSRQTTRLKNMRTTNEQMKSTVNFALMQANKIEEQTALKMSRAIQLINDPDLQMQFKPNEKLTTQQKIAKKKQEEMQSLLKSFVTSEVDLLRFSKSVTEVKNDENQQQK